MCQLNIPTVALSSVLPYIKQTGKCFVVEDCIMYYFYMPETTNVQFGVLSFIKSITLKKNLV